MMTMNAIIIKVQQTVFQETGDSSEVANWLAWWYRYVADSYSVMVPIGGDGIDVDDLGGGGGGGDDGDGCGGCGCDSVTVTHSRRK